jgi:hypothetical protein
MGSNLESNSSGLLRIPETTTSLETVGHLQAESGTLLSSISVATICVAPSTKLRSSRLNYSAAKWNWNSCSSRDYDFARDWVICRRIPEPCSHQSPLPQSAWHHLQSWHHRGSVTALRNGIETRGVLYNSGVEKPFILVQYVGHSLVEWMRDVTKDSLPEPSRRSDGEASRSYL